MTLSKEGEEQSMWEALDFRDHSLVRFAQRDLWREAAMRSLARKLREPRPSMCAQLRARFSLRREAGGSTA
jgi:hypothetical protein